MLPGSARKRVVEYARHGRGSSHKQTPAQAQDRGRTASLGAEAHASLRDALRRFRGKARGTAQRDARGNTAPLALSRTVYGVLSTRGREGYGEQVVRAGSPQVGGRYRLPRRGGGTQEGLRAGSGRRHGSRGASARVLRGPDG